MQPMPQQTQAQAKAARLTKQEARILAAEKAARTFSANRATLFDTARVTGAMLKTAVHSMVARTLATTPGISPRSEVRVIFGDGACIKHEWTTVDARTRMVRAVIMLPDFDDAATLPRSFADELCAYTLHELAHALFTNPNAFASGIRNLARYHNISEEDAKGIINAIEDVRIERALLSSGHALGFAGVIRGLLARTVAEAVANGCEEAFAAGDRTAWGFAFAFGARGYAPGAEGFRDALQPYQVKQYDKALAALANIKPNERGTAEVVDLASSVLTALAFDAPQPPQPPQPPEGDQPQPPEGEGEGEGGEGEEGEGTPEEGGENGAQPGQNGPQEGEGGEGTPEEGEGKSKAPGGLEGGADSNAEAPGAEEAVEGNTMGGNASGATKAGTGKDQPAPPPPGTFRDTEIAPQAVPESCKAEGTSIVQPPRVVAREVTPETARHGQSLLADALRGFSKSGALGANLRRLFTRTDRDELDAGLRSGRLRIGALPRVACGAENVFARRHSAEGFNSAVSILIDGSGSMQGRALLANRAVALLVKALASCNGVRSKVQVFQEGHSNSTVNGLAEEAAHQVGMSTRFSDVTLTVLKDYTDAPAHGYACLSQPIASGSTPDLEAMTMAGNELAKRSERRKVLLLIVDGGTNRIALTEKQIAVFKRRGIVTIAIGISYNPQGYEHAINVESLNDLGSAAFRKVCDVVAKQTI